jgi:hypothetical protein
MDQEQRCAAKTQLVAWMQAGQPWQTAAAQAGLQTSQSNAYRLMKAFRQHGETHELRNELLKSSEHA